METMTAIFTNLQFIRPMALWSLPVVLFILWYLQRNHGKDDGWAKICDPHLLQAIKIKSAGKGSNWSLLLWPISIIAVLAIAGPAFRKMPTPVIKNQSALVIVLDVSRSMLADDIKPNRLERAKFKINDILDQRKDGQTALVVYAGDAFVVTPLTDDTETIALMLKAIAPDIMPVQGSRVDIALNKAQQLLQQAGYVTGDVLLVGDGVNLNKAQIAAKKLLDNRITTSVLAIGTKEGAPIPTAQGFVKDTAGNIVVPKLQVSALKKLATAGNGRFAQISGNSSDIDYLIPTQVEQNSKSQTDTEDAYDTEKLIDEGPWLVLLLLPLFVLLFRKGLLLALFLVVGLQTPQSSYALTWDDLWLNADQKAAKQLQNGQVDAAFETAKSDNWKATAAFRKKDYTQASELFNDGSADGFYNQGNALAQSGKLQEALEAYNQSLQIRADDEDTLYNKKQVEQALEQQQQNKDQQDQEQNQEQEQQNQEQDQQDQQSGEDKQQDKQDSDGKEQDGEEQSGEENQDQGDNPQQQEQESESESGEMTEEEKKQQQQQEKELAQEDEKAAEQEAKERQQQEVKLTPEELAENAENKEAIEQWLRRIPDDPGGLLRRKFYYQYNQQNHKPDETDDW
ncbi:Aerotolerance protein BatB / Aerotolerance protein BatC [hydrothermal vent metagenome]|uniref:Aerotolerance protein BatB / Aerotolerance protein BatC n=1 Tax=hydrothermal vent metagenome TaxID=652676 RepID=A0A3B0VF28_9ZZZZ